MGLLYVVIYRFRGATVMSSQGSNPNILPPFPQKGENVIFDTSAYKVIDVTWDYSNQPQVIVIVDLE